MEGSASRRDVCHWSGSASRATSVRGLLRERRFREVPWSQPAEDSWPLPAKNRAQPTPPLRCGLLDNFVILERPAPPTLRPAPLPRQVIIVPVFNGIDYVRQCIESIYSVTTKASFEVIAVDQASSDGSREYLRQIAHQHANFRLIENPINVGFPQAINQGANAAQAAYLAVVNSDTIVTPNWLDYLLRAMRDDPQLAVVSPMTNYVGEGPQLATDARDLRRIRPPCTHGNWRPKPT